MQNASKTVTVYRKVWNEETAADEYHGTVLSGVSFFSRLATTVATEGTEAACEGLLRIPVTAAPLNFALHNGDIVCEGEHPTSGKRPGDLSDLCTYVFTVVSVTQNSTGRAPHIKAVCK